MHEHVSPLGPWLPPARGRSPRSSAVFFSSFFSFFSFFYLFPRPPVRGRGRPLLGLSVAASAGGGRPLSLLPLACSVCLVWCLWLWLGLVLLVVLVCLACPAVLLVVCLSCGVLFVWLVLGVLCGLVVVLRDTPAAVSVWPAAFHVSFWPRLRSISCVNAPAFRACQRRRGRQHTRAWILMGVVSARPATWAFWFCRLTTRQGCGGVVPAACALTCSPTVCPAAGLLVSPGRGGTGVGRRWLVPCSLWVWPVFCRCRCFMCSQGYDPGST